MSGREHRTRRGALLADLEWGRTPDGYMVEGHDVRRPTDGRPWWRVTHVVSGVRWDAATLTDALELVAGRVRP